MLPISGHSRLIHQDRLDRLSAVGNRRDKRLFVERRIEHVRTKLLIGDECRGTVSRAYTTDAPRIDIGEPVTLGELELNANIGRLLRVTRNVLQRAIGAEVHGKRAGIVKADKQDLAVPSA